MASATCYTRYSSPIGSWLLMSDGLTLTGVFPESHRAVPMLTAGWRRNDAFFGGIRDQLDEYFAGRLTDFTVRLGAKGTSFQQRVWTALRDIPAGTTTTYAALGSHLGHPAAARAIGAAIGRNPIALIVPCHRVVGADGTLTGYAGGLELKHWLLDHEATLRRRAGSGVTPIGLMAVARGAVQLTLS